MNKKQEMTKMSKRQCEHKDGWISIERLVIDPRLGNDENEIEFECNATGCTVRKFFRFDVTNIEEVD
jgi:hypothetical protein